MVAFLGGGLGQPLGCFHCSRIGRLQHLSSCSKEFKLIGQAPASSGYLLFPPLSLWDTSLEQVAHRCIANYHCFSFWSPLKGWSDPNTCFSCSFGFAFPALTGLAGSMISYDTLPHSQSGMGEWDGWAQSGLTRASLPLPVPAHIRSRHLADLHRDVLGMGQTVKAHSNW